MIMMKFMNQYNIRKSQFMKIISEILFIIIQWIMRNWKEKENIW